MINVRFLGFCFLLAAAGTMFSVARAADEDSLVFSVVKWQGTYTSKDIPGGVAHPPTTTAIYTIRADGSELKQIVAMKPNSENPAYSLDVLAPQLGYLYMNCMNPAGDAVVCAGPTSQYRLWLLRLPETYEKTDAKPVVLTPDHPESMVPQYTADGRWVVFTRRDGDIYRADVTGGGVQRLTKGNNYSTIRLSREDTHGSRDTPSISPNGRRIAYGAVRNGVPNVYTMNVDGSDQKQITFRKTPCGRACWSPDGKRLAFVSFDDKYSQLYVVPAGGGEPQRLTNLDGAVYLINWRPRAK